MPATKSDIIARCTPVAQLSLAYNQRHAVKREDTRSLAWRPSNSMCHRGRVAVWVMYTETSVVYALKKRRVH